MRKLERRQETEKEKAREKAGNRKRIIYNTLGPKRVLMIYSV